MWPLDQWKHDTWTGICLRGTSTNAVKNLRTKMQFKKNLGLNCNLKKNLDCFENNRKLKLDCFAVKIGLICN